MSPAIKVHDCGCQWGVHVAMALFTLGYIAQAGFSVLLAHHPLSSYDHPHTPLRPVANKVDFS